MPVVPPVAEFFRRLLCMVACISFISLSCPLLLRYAGAGACIILQERLQHLVKDTMCIILHASGSYSDPVTRILLALFSGMDFDDAQPALQQRSLVCKISFLVQHLAEFEENARLLMFKTDCRIHQCINIEMMASKLNMEAEKAELWTAKQVQTAELDARIGFENSRMVMSNTPPNVYQQVFEWAKSLTVRSTMLFSHLEKREKRTIMS